MGITVACSDAELPGVDNPGERPVPEKPADPTPYVTRVLDYRPAPGQFVNSIPEYEEGDTQETMNGKVLDALCEGRKGLVSLGGYGGYVVVGFDHTIANKPGLRDFRVLGNAFENSCEPGIVCVAYDRNGNGLPDEDEWYEIAGSAQQGISEAWYEKAGLAGNDVNVVSAYEITYQATTDGKAIGWSDNQGQTGTIGGGEGGAKTSPAARFPRWISDQTLTFRGTRLPQNGLNEPQDEYTAEYHKLYRYGFGYADNVANTNDDACIDIGWAVDREGKPVDLPGVDFVKVYTGVLQTNGWLGECSTEVMGVEDLHLLTPSAGTNEGGGVQEADSQPNPPVRAAGFYVLNEGWFGHADPGSVNYFDVDYDNNTLTPHYRIYQEANKDDGNKGLLRGTTSQFATIWGDNVYILAKQGTTVTIADAKTFKTKKTFGLNGQQPNFFLGVDEKKGYIGTRTSGVNGGISIVDLESMTVTGTVPGIVYQIGNMCMSDGKIFALADRKVYVIDPQTDQLIKTISETYDGRKRFNRICKSLDGQIWIVGNGVVTTGAKGHLARLNPTTLELEEKIEFPDGFAIGENWGAFNAGDLCASTQRNLLYWSNGTRILQYDVDHGTFNTDFFALGTSEYKQAQEILYGAGMRVDPLTDELILTTCQKGYGVNYAYNWVYRVSPQGQLLSRTELFGNNSNDNTGGNRGDRYYWFPAIPFFQDANKPQILLNSIALKGGEETVMDLSAKMVDYDNMPGDMVKRVRVPEGSSLQARIEGNKLVLKGDMPGTSTLTLAVMSNGVVVEKEVRVVVR
jgi:hypothetical protein